MSSYGSTFWPMKLFNFLILPFFAFIKELGMTSHCNWNLFSWLLEIEQLFVLIFPSPEVLFFSPVAQLSSWLSFQGLFLDVFVMFWLLICDYFLNFRSSVSWALLFFLFIGGVFAFCFSLLMNRSFKFQSQVNLFCGCIFWWVVICVFVFVKKDHASKWMYYINRT